MKPIIVITAICLATGVALGATLTSVISDTQRSTLPISNGLITTVRNGAATILCDESESSRGLDPGDCSASNVCFVSIRYCDANAQDLTNARVSVDFGYPVSSTIVPK
jgi:hypothetical protein